MVILYDLIFIIFAAVSFPFFLIRLRRASDPKRLLKDRLGLAAGLRTAERDAREVIWIHAVSVGEVLGVAPFLKEARSRYPQFHFVLSTTTPTGFEMAETLALTDTPVFYVPFDVSWITNRVMRALRPRALLLMETELWPNLIRSAHIRGVRLGLINGRLSPKSFRRYVWVRSLTRPLLQKFAFVAVQTSRDRDRFLALGAPDDRTHVVGSIKFDEAVKDAPYDVNGIRGRLGLSPDTPVFLGGSTHPGEEVMLLEAARSLKETIPSLVVILAPRHVDRAPRIVSHARAEGWNAGTYSEPGAQADVLVIDKMGVLRELYAVADVVFMGGSFIKHGGQNPIEAVRCRRGVISGPYVFNFQSVFDLLVEAEGACIVRSREELCRVARKLFSNHLERNEMGARAARLLEKLTGAVERHMSLFEQAVLSDRSASPDVKKRALRYPLISRFPFGQARASLRLWYVHLLEGSRRDAWSSGMLAALRLGSVFFRAGVFVRNWLYDKNYSSRKELVIPVVSVGNLTWGGTGKTPLVRHMAEYFHRKNKDVLVLTRGYGADEVRELKRNLPLVRVAVGRDRYRTAVRSLLERRSDIAILDDGFQHRALSRQLDIVTINALNPFGSERLIPAGILREPVRNMARAGFVVITHTNLVSEDILKMLYTRLRMYGHDETTVAEAIHEPEHFYRARSGETFLPERFSHKPVLAFSGIGHPASFEGTLRRAGLELAGSVRFGDHHQYSVEELRHLKRDMPSEGDVITTEKDFLRAPDLMKETVNPLVLRVHIRITKGKERLHARLDALLDH